MVTVTMIKLRREEGQNMVVVALAMVAMLAFLALVLDLGFAYAWRRRMQNAADAGAFAGAWELAFSETPDPVGRAQEYAVQRNGADSAHVTVDGDRVTVVATKTFPTFFAGVIGIPSITVAARATAQVTSRPAFEWALFANDDDDEALKLNGNSLRVVGNIHSNGGIRINGSRITIDGGTESVGHFCLNGNRNTIGAPLEITPSGGYSINGNQNSYPEPVYTANWESIPVFDINDYGPERPDWVSEDEWHYYSDDLHINGNDITLDEGLYYVEGDIHINGNRIQGNVTLVATGDIHLNGNRLDFTTYDGHIVLFSNSGDIHINGNDIELHGIIYDPEGEVHINGNSLAAPIDGSVLADTIRINGNNIDIIHFNPDYVPSIPGFTLIE